MGLDFDDFINKYGPTTEYSDLNLEVGLNFIPTHLKLDKI